jgi:mono/diheme cytochrome c family protein
MRHARVALSCALIAVGVAAACTKSPEREQGDFERMRVQQRDEPYEAYASRGRLAREEGMRQPPTGTMSRESEGDSGAVGSGMRAGQPVTTVPLDVTPALLALGQQKFDVYCAVCHGAGGFGGSIVAENMGAPRPPSLRSAAMEALPPGFVFNIATHGIGRMPPYAPQLTARERWAVVAYLEQLQRATSTTPEQREDSLRALDIRSIDSTLAAEQQR